MDKFRRDDAKAEAGSEYGEELLSANWNPVIDLLAWSCGHTRDVVNKRADSMSESEVADFLDRIYTSGA